jgi:transcription elongation factor Elf1
MKRVKSKNPVLDGSDILFECGQCGKSLAIDCRGAGLNVHCPECDSELEVPIPEGFDLAELDKAISDSAVADREVRVQTPNSDDEVAAISAAADAEINRLKAEIETIHAQQTDLTSQNAEMLEAIKAVKSQIDKLHEALDKLASLLAARNGSKLNDTQKLF